MKKRESKQHVGVVTARRPGKFGIAITRPHDDGECAEARQDAERALEASEPQDDEPEGETIYEDKSSTSVGYSKAYAANYDSVFKN